MAGLFLQGAKIIYIDMRTTIMRGRSPVNTWCRMLVHDVGVRSSDERWRRQGHQPDDEMITGCCLGKGCLGTLPRHAVVSRTWTTPYACFARRFSFPLVRARVMRVDRLRAVACCVIGAAAVSFLVPRYHLRKLVRLRQAVEQNSWR